MKLDSKIVKAHANGRWSAIITTLTPRLAQTVERGKRHGPCPLCEGKDRARCHNDFNDTGGIICNQCGGGADGLAVLMWANSWTFPETLESVANYLGLTDSTFQAPRHRTPRSQSNKGWKRESRGVLAIWEGATPNHPRLNEYLEYRGLSTTPPDALRLHPSLEYWYEGKSYGKFACMVARIIKEGELVGIHRTFLDPDGPGKAPVMKPKLSKKCADTMSGGSIRLFEPEADKPLVLCEGIESSLAVYEITGFPVWSCINSTMLEIVVLPDNVKSIIIGADKDRSGAGQASAEKLGRRFAGTGWDVKISLPPMPIPEGASGVDWLDYLNKEVAHV